MKKGQSKARSSSSSVVPAITAGKANTIISATTSMAQANTGMRISVMPGARVNRMPMISSIAPAMAEISMKPMPSSHQSAPQARRELLAGERRVHEPAAVGRRAEEDRAEEGQAADRVGPEGIGRQPRERQVARAQHARQQVDRDRLDDRHREQEHHHGAVHREELVVGAAASTQRVVGHGELRAHQQRQHAGQHEEQQRGARCRTAPMCVLLTAESRRQPLGGAPGALQRLAFAWRARQARSGRASASAVISSCASQAAMRIAGVALVDAVASTKACARRA